jgi:hypothetical protein
MLKYSPERESGRQCMWSTQQAYKKHADCKFEGLPYYLLSIFDPKPLNLFLWLSTEHWFIVGS